MRWSTQIWAVGLLSTDGQQLRGTPALHLNEPNWIIDGFNELIVDFLSQLGLFLDSTQPQPLKNPKQIHFFWIKQTNINETQ